MTTTPALWQFLGAYLHQDWPIEFDDEWATLDRFIEGEPELASHCSPRDRRELLRPTRQSPHFGLTSWPRVHDFTPAEAWATAPGSPRSHAGSERSASPTRG